MRTLAFCLACYVCIVEAGRIHVTSTPMQALSHEERSPRLEALEDSSRDRAMVATKLSHSTSSSGAFASLLLTLADPAAGWQIIGTHSGHPRKLSMGSHTVGHPRSTMLSPPIASLSEVTRRQGLTAVFAASFSQLPLVAAAAGGSVRDGMAAFSEGKVEESVEIFDKVIKTSPSSKPFLWQRGLSLYYVDRFQDGAEQFATDVSVNPDDTEESIWNFLCVARIEGLDAARKKMLKVGFDRRPVMRAAQQLFAGTVDEAPLQAFATGRSESDIFYANLYLGLYREAQGDAAGARQYITAATGSRYGKESGDYMADLAKVHVQRRGW